MNENLDLKRRYKWLHDEVVQILYRHDPIGIGMTTDGPQMNMNRRRVQSYPGCKEYRQRQS